MSRNNRISCVEQADGSIDIVVPASMAALFQEMVARATRSWQDQHPEIRDFADRLLKRDHIMGSNMKEGLVTAEVEPIRHPSLGKSLLREPISATNPLPAGCYCKPGMCGAPKANWCRDVVKRDAEQALAKRSCCGTLLREPHHTQCPERLKDSGSNSLFKPR